MSLSSEIQRVDGAQNDILRALAQSYGINTSGLKIDQIAEKVKASQKFKLDGLLSAATAGLFGLPAASTPDDAFKKIKATFDTVQGEVDSKIQVVNGSYVGTDSASKTITFEADPFMLFVVGFSNSKNKYTGVTTIISGQPFCLGFTYANWGLGPTHSSVGGDGLKIDWSGKSVTITGPDKDHSLNMADHSYQYVSILK